MGKVDDIVASFTLAGVLDETTKTREKCPIAELMLEDIADHPANSTYSMDEGAIKSLAESIKRDGLTDIPLVRRLPDGSFQMLSGHRRKAAYKLLAKSDDTFRKLPCRIIDNIDDSKALALLHSANYFTRELTALERAAATKALESEVVKLRQVNPELKGVRTRDIKASILKAQTGREVSGRTVAHHEKIASLIENKLSPSWKDLASKGEISDSKIQDLASNDFEVQEVLYKKWTKNNVADIDSKAKESHRQTKKIRNLIADLKKVASQSNLTASDKALVYKELKELTLNFL